MSQSALNVPSLLLPVESGMLLLPNAAVAEIVEYREPRPAPGAPVWYLGRVPWRGLEVPLLAFDATAGGPRAQQRLRIAILNTLNATPGMPFVGLALCGIPRLLSAGPHSVEACTDGVAEGTVLAQVQVGGEPAIIPDLDALERLVATLPPAA